MKALGLVVSEIKDRKHTVDNSSHLLAIAKYNYQALGHNRPSLAELAFPCISNTYTMQALNRQAGGGSLEAYQAE